MNAEKITVTIKESEAQEFINKAMDLLERTLPMLENGAPDANWLRDYFTLTGQWAVRTDEGWELGGERDYEDGEILEEVNKP